MLCIIIYCITRWKLYNYQCPKRKTILLRFNIGGLVETHHVVPNQWKNHPVLNEYNYRVSDPSNLMFMPNALGLEKINTNRLYHSGGHTPYNEYVKKRLDAVTNEGEFKDLVRHLRYSMRGNPDGIPWK